LTDSRVVLLAAYDGIFLLVALCAEHVEVGYSNFYRFEIIILLQTVVKLIIALAVQSEKKIILTSVALVIFLY
jgi:hypothetical protein